MDSQKVDRDQATSFGQSGSLCFGRGEPTERGGCEVKKGSDEMARMGKQRFDEDRGIKEVVGSDKGRG